MVPPLRRLRRSALLLFGRATCSLRTLPDFLIIGTQKGGTTSLYRYLAQHPQVLPVRRKEIHYFDLNYRRGLCWYRAHLPLALRKRLVSERRRSGEASPYYLFHPLVPERVARTLPEVRLIALLRNPVDRAYSHFEHSVSHGQETLPSFEAAIEAEPQRLAAAGTTAAALQHHSYLARGRYAEQLERWFQVVPRDRLLVLRSEAFFADTAETFAQVQRFLGLEPWRPAAFPSYNANRYRGLAGATRRQLERYFEPHNRRLAQLLGQPLWWPPAETSDEGAGAPAQ